MRSGARTLSVDQVREIAGCLNGRTDGSIWPALLAAGGAGVLPGQDHASWLPEHIELSWAAAPEPGPIEVRAEVVAAPTDDPIPTAVLRTVARQEGTDVAEVLTRARLRSEAGGRRPVSLGDPPRSERTVRVVTPEEVTAYCQALRTQWWSTTGLVWAGVHPRPQPVVPLTLLTALAARAVVPGPASIVATMAEPVLAGSLLRWVVVPGQVWVLTPAGAPAVRFDLTEKEPATR